MAITRANLLSEAYEVYIGDTDADVPEVDDNSDGTLIIDGTDFVQVYTEGPVKLDYEAEMTGVKVNGFLSEIKKVLIGESAKIGFSIAEEDLSMFNYAISASTLSAVAAGSSQAAQDVLTIGDGSIVEKQLVLVGKSPEGGFRAVIIPIAVCTGSFSKETQVEHTPIPVEFEVLGDTSASAGSRLMTIYDWTAAPTA